jgi:hypothetical protein
VAAIKQLADIVKKWTTVTPQRSADYVQGVTNPRTDWADATAAADDSWKAGVAAAAAAGRFASGVNKAGTAKWKKNATEKGPVRWQQGIGLAADLYQRGFAPFREAIAGLALPPRFANRDPRNLDRVAAIVQAMIQTKEQQG